MSPLPGSKKWFTTCNDPLFGGTVVCCTCCEKPLTGRAIRMLEFDQRSDTYHDFQDVPEHQSQGWFPFGLSCGRKKVEIEKKRRRMPKGPAGDRGQVGWMGGEFDR